MNASASPFVAAKPAEAETALAAVAAILLANLGQLANSGGKNVACRLAECACVNQSSHSPSLEQSFNALLHRLTSRLPGGAP